MKISEAFIRPLFCSGDRLTLKSTPHLGSRDILTHMSVPSLTLPTTLLHLASLPPYKVKLYLANDALEAPTSCGKGRKIVQTSLHKHPGMNPSLLPSSKNREVFFGLALALAEKMRPRPHPTLHFIEIIIYHREI